MKTRDERDELIRRTFRELRDEDLRALPSFERTLARSSGRAAGRAANHRAAWLAGAVVLVLAGVGLIVAWDLVRRPPVQSVESTAARLVDWRSPTERLLQTTGRDLTRELPRIGAYDFENFDAAVARTKEPVPTPLRN